MVQHLKRRPDGRFVCRYKGKSFYGATEKEALKARDSYKKMISDGMADDADSATVRWYAARWLPAHKASVSNKCYNDYARQLDVLLDVLGDLTVRQVQPTDCMRVWQHYLGYSQSTIKRSRMLFISLFDTAQEEGYCRVNPFRSRHAQPHKGSAGSHRQLERWERDLIDAVDHPFALAVRVMLYAGLRRGEVLALDVDRDVDFLHHVIHVREAVRYEHNQPILDAPKTEAGVRDVPMVSALEEELRGHHGLVARPVHGRGQMSEAAFRSAWAGYLRALETHLNGHQKRWHHRESKAKVVDLVQRDVEALEDSGDHAAAEALRLSDWRAVTIRPHDLRHTYCTMLRDAGVDLKLAMQWMGHGDEKMILRIYDHVTDYRKQQAMASVEAMLRAQQKGSQAPARSQNGSQIL